MLPPWQLPPEQHPVGQSDALHPVQAPPTQFWPPGQIWQVPPDAPQAGLVSPGWHRFEESQHPTGQVDALQAQLPAEQIWPETHAAPEPQPHACDVQVSDSPEQTTHAAPPWPQLLSAVPGRQVFPEQQPVGHDVASHTQAPAPLQRWPAAHGAPPPHRHWPLGQALAVEPQGTQTSPFEPQAPALFPARQLLALQQPEGHDVESQTQLPLTHRWPEPHAGLLPQRQPPLLQVSVLPAHDRQAPPLVPQAPADVPGMQLLPLQQPVGHELGSQTHEPVEQLWPTAQAAPLPQRQAPAGEQLLANVESQVWQAPPSAPQLVSEGVVQIPFRQQPFAQFEELQPEQAWLVQVWVPGHCWHWPPTPQFAAVSPARQLLPLQQPVGQDVASQTHPPGRQRRPAAQATDVDPQVQTPLMQLSAAVALHGAQATPPVPQADAVPETQVFPLQQPFGHEVASQTQLWPTQCWPAAQAAPEPHLQVPPEQRSVVTVSQATQTWPLVPHDSLVEARHRPL